MRRQALVRPLMIGGAAGVAAALAIALAGGGVFEIGAIRVGLREPIRPLIAGLAAIAIGSVLSAPTRPSGSGAFRWSCFMLCLASIGVWLATRVTTCGGLDSYAYVSAAHMIAGGHLHQPEPIVHLLPEGAARAATPMGYLLSTDGSAIVPEFPLGLPLLMALFLGIGGTGGPFWVAPVCGAVAVWLTGLIARRVADETTAWLAALLVAVHPIFVTQAIQPMSDVPATMWLLGAIFFLVRSQPQPLVAGMAAGLAFWTRPALLLPGLVAVLLLSPHAGDPGAEAHSASRQRSFDRHLAYLAALGVFVVVQAAAQWHLYGSPFTSGRGAAAGHLFELDRVAGNLWNYARWFTYLHTPVIYVALAVGLWRRRPARWTGVALLMVGAGIAPYFAYVRFDDWETLRYWLPVIPLLLIVASDGTVALAARLAPARWVPALLIVLAVLIAASSCAFLKRTATFTLAGSEARYAILGEWLRVHTPPDAVVIASLHSGSIRLYGERLTLRWDEIPPELLRATVSAVTSRGRRCFVAIDGTEQAQFERRFADVLGGLRTYPAGGFRDMVVLSLEPGP